MNNIVFQVYLGFIFGLQWSLLLWLQTKSWQTISNLLFSFYFLACFLWRSSRPEVFCKNRVLRFFTKFTRKHLCQSLFFNKIAGVRPTTLLKRRLWQRFFPVNSVKLLRKPFFTEHPWWLLLFISRQVFHDLRYRRTSCFKLLLNTWATCIESISTWKHALK